MTDRAPVTYRDAGVSLSRLIALFARWSGMPNTSESLKVSDLINSFRLADVPREPIVFTDADHHNLT